MAPTFWEQSRTHPSNLKSPSPTKRSEILCHEHFASVVMLAIYFFDTIQDITDLDIRHLHKPRIITLVLVLGHSNENKPAAQVLKGGGGRGGVVKARCLNSAIWRK